MTKVTQARDSATKTCKHIPSPVGKLDMEGRPIFLITEEDWEYVIDTLNDYFDALEVQEMMKDPEAVSIPWEEAKKRLIANNIKKVRQRKKMTQVKLAKKLRVSQARVSEIEDPSYRPTIAVYKRVAKALDCPVETLMAPGSP